MLRQPSEPTRERAERLAVPAWLGIFSLQDIILLVYLGLFWVLVAVAPPHPDRGHGLCRIAVATATLVSGCAIGRGASRLPGWLRSAAYRFGAVAAAVQGYLMLKWVLPVIRRGDVDAALLSIDRRLFGETPAIWLEAFATPTSVEYFSFFYASYFGLCAIYTFAVLGCGKAGRSTTRFAIGTLLVVCVGQLGYVAVPAYGPVAAMATSFDGPLSGGAFWALVHTIVDGSGAQKDVFPSLHTALPTWFSIYAWSEARTQPRWRWAALATTVFAAHIVVSTMFLRWHYAIDVVAGWMLAAFAAWISPWLSVLDERRRSVLGMNAVWSFGNRETSA